MYEIDDMILVVPSDIKKEVIRENSLKGINNIKYMTLDEVYKHFYFDYDNKTIYSLMNKYNIKYDIAVGYLKNLYYVFEESKGNKKLLKLMEIRKYLDDNDLLIYDDLFIKLITKKKIVIYGYCYLKEEDYVLIDGLKKYTDVTIKNFDKGNYIHDEVYYGSLMEEEITFICENIVKLINQGISISNIKLMNVCDDYVNELKRISSFYNLKIDLDSSTSIYDTYYGKKFLEDFDLDRVYDNEVKNKIISILNNYMFASNYEDVKSLLINDFKNNYLPSLKYEDMIQIVKIESYIPNDMDYVFCLSFNEGVIPMVHKDEEYITDSLCSVVHKSTSISLNILDKESVINKLSLIKNLVITYRTSDGKGGLYPSDIINVLNMKKSSISREYKYSDMYNKILLANKIDDLIKYGEQDDLLSILYSKYRDIGYLSYDNKFTSLKSGKLDNILLSYTSLDSYYKCSFKYYINYILKLSIYEDTFLTYIGNLFHYVLSKAFDDDFDFDGVYEEFIRDNERDFSFKEKHFIKKLKKELVFIIETIKYQNSYSTFNDAFYEKEVQIKISDRVTFTGKIDKILYRKYNDKTLGVIIDYKTGNLKLNLNNIIHGLGMQLPIYLYLMENMHEFNNLVVVGFYLQKILPIVISRDPKKSYEEVRKSNLKLGGYSIDDEEYLELFDNSYSDSRVIASLKKSNNGFSSYSKIISFSDIDKIINITDEKIRECSKDILDLKFDINPKMIGNDNYGCEYCKFKDICFMKQNDIVRLKEYKKMEFLQEKV